MSVPHLSLAEGVCHGEEVRLVAGGGEGAPRLRLPAGHRGRLLGGEGRRRHRHRPGAAGAEVRGGREGGGRRGELGGWWRGEVLAGGQLQPAEAVQAPAGGEGQLVQSPVSGLQSLVSSL